jgi:hypothetical protein
MGEKGNHTRSSMWDKQSNLHPNYHRPLAQFGKPNRQLSLRDSGFQATRLEPEHQLKAELDRAEQFECFQTIEELLNRKRGGEWGDTYSGYAAAAKGLGLPDNLVEDNLAEGGRKGGEEEKVREELHLGAGG